MTNDAAAQAAETVRRADETEEQATRTLAAVAGTEAPPPARAIMGDAERDKENLEAIRQLQNIVRDGRRTFETLENRLELAYFVVLGISVGTFLIGVALIATSIYEAVWGGGNVDQSLVSGGLGIADIAALFLFRPGERVQALMGDMSQLAMALNGYLAQTNLRLIQMRVNDPATVGIAADEIRRATDTSVRLVQDYFETKKRR